MVMWLTLSPLGPGIPAPPLSPGIPCRPGGPWAPAPPAGPMAPCDGAEINADGFETQTQTEKVLQVHEYWTVRVIVYFSIRRPSRFEAEWKRILDVFVFIYILITNIKNNTVSFWEDVDVFNKTDQRSSVSEACSALVITGLKEWKKKWL